MCECTITTFGCMHHGGVVMICNFFNVCIHYTRLWTLELQRRSVEAHGPSPPVDAFALVAVARKLMLGRKYVLTLFERRERRHGLAQSIKNGLSRIDSFTDMILLKEKSIQHFIAG